MSPFFTETPFGVVTITVSFNAMPGARIAVILVGDTTVKELAGKPPIETAVIPVK